MSCRGPYVLGKCNVPQTHLLKRRAPSLGSPLPPLFLSLEAGRALLVFGLLWEALAPGSGDFTRL